MYRHNKIIRKERRKAKKTNCNKQKNAMRRDFTNNYMPNGVDKAIQMRLREEGIKVHKMDLRPMRCGADRLDRDFVVGNAKQGIIIDRYKVLLRELEDDAESSAVHDMTRWKASKKKTEARKRERQFKTNNQRF